MTKNTNGITFLDFFAGIGGFRTAVERLGGKCLGFAEIDKHARQSYKALYNTEGEREWHDITQVTDTEFAELAGKVDLINAGFPCQAFSVAGKRQGFEDSRGTLFYEVARAAKAIRPKYILLENVKGLLSHDKGNTVDVIFRTLNEIGYTIDFTVLNSKHFGVPQNRERIFIMAVRDDLVTQEAWNIEGTGVVAKAKRRFSGYENIKSFNFFGWSAQHTTVSKRLRDVLEAQVDEKYYLSDEKTAKMIDLVGSLVQDKDCIDSRQKSADKVRLYTDICPTLTGTETKDVKKIVEQKTQVIADLNHYSQEALNRIYGIDGQSPTIDTMQGGGREPKIAVESGISVVGDLRLYGCKSLNEVYGVEGISPTLLSMQGGHQEPRIAEPIEVRATLTPDRVEKRQQGRRFKENDEAAFTVNCVDRHGVMIGTKPTYRIRKLTPLECWRLQGFSDEQHQKAVDAGVSNSQRYKQAGNSVTVNVIEAIVTQLIVLDGTIQNESTEVA